MFDPTILDLVFFGTAISYGLKFFQTSQKDEHQAAVKASRNRLGSVYVERREALTDLAGHMEEYSVHCNETAEYKQVMTATDDSINESDRAIAELKRSQVQDEDGKIDLDELSEQVRWAEEQQELWLMSIKELRERWSVG
jgi:uncharacterized protein (DUF3084 family)